MPWDLRPNLRSEPANGGVYLLAHCSSGSAPANATLERLPFEVIYVGNTKNLNVRPARGCHSGVELYHTRVDPTDERLFVTVAPLFETACADYAVQRIYSHCIEAALVWTYTQRHGYPPLLNYTHKSLYAAEVATLITDLKHGREAT
jgi:hypothetical protein